MNLNELKQLVLQEIDEFQERWRQEQLKIPIPEPIHAALTSFYEAATDIKSGKLEYEPTNPFRPPANYSVPVTINYKNLPDDNGFYGEAVLARAKIAYHIYHLVRATENGENFEYLIRIMDDTNGIIRGTLNLPADNNEIRSFMADPKAYRSNRYSRAQEKADNLGSAIDDALEDDGYIERDLEDLASSDGAMDDLEDYTSDDYRREAAQRGASGARRVHTPTAIRSMVADQAKGAKEEPKTKKKKEGNRWQQIASELELDDKIAKRPKKKKKKVGKDSRFTGLELDEIKRIIREALKTKGII
mgnify:CR=1 FL=1|jgi:hypothetical protein|tara:strand:+ start:19337 stop:20245 length:909 start_codon:yes stop_codon:yes gene_type:complete